MEKGCPPHECSGHQCPEYGHFHPVHPPQFPGSDLTSEDLNMLFHTVDKDNDGEIGPRELQSALTNGFLLSFHIQLCELLISMYDRHGKGTSHMDEFCHLWKYVSEWIHCFRTFDENCSGSIDIKELGNALSSFGYRLNPTICHLLMSKFDRHGNGTLLFDDFVQCCIMLHTVTGAFRNMDRDRDGFITISYEQFVNIVISVAVNG